MQYRRAYASQVAGVEYVEVAKAGCTSIKWALLESDGHQVRDGFHAHTHRAFEEIPADWTPRHVFTFIRHPLDRLVSNYREKLQKGLARRLRGNCPLPTSAPFSHWCAWVCRQDPRAVDRHWGPQHLILGRRGNPKPHLYRFEQMNAWWQRLREQFNGLADLGRHNVTSAGQPAWQEYYTQADLDLAAQFYAGDLTRYDYELPEPVEHPAA